MSLKFGKSWLLNLYRQLPYIVYRDSYLIPHPPPVPPNGPSLEQTDLFAFQKLLEYTQQYILPIKRINRLKLPHLVFYEENKERLSSQFRQAGNRFNMKVLLDAYNALPYEQQDEYRNRETDPTLVKFEEKHRIPSVVSQRPYILYLKATKQHPITPDKYKLFSKLSKNQQKLYVQKAERLNKARKREMHAFLGRLGLSQKEFEHIRGVCRAIKEMATKSRRLKAQKAEKIKNLAISQKKNEEIPSKKSQKPLKIKMQLAEERIKALSSEAIPQPADPKLEEVKIQVKTSSQVKQQLLKSIKPQKPAQITLNASQQQHSETFPQKESEQQQIVAEQFTKQQLQELEYINEDYELKQLKKLISQALAKSKTL